MNKKHIVSFSGGKDSTAMLLRMSELGMQIDEVIFVDNGWEFQEMVATYYQVKKMLPYKFTLIDLKERFHYLFYDHICKKGKHEGKKGGFPSVKMRWCSREKGRAIDRHVKKLGKCVQYLGIAYDEIPRTLGYSEIKITRYPLIEWKWDERKCLEYCYQKGVDFQGYYDKFKRGGCWCCPIQSLSSLRILYKEYPELWEELKVMQKHSNISFRMDGSTVFDLEKRFKGEDRQLKLPFKNE